jgi:hypothetical protein
MMFARSDFCFLLAREQKIKHDNLKQLKIIKISNMDEEESNNNRPKEKSTETELKDKSGIVLSPRPQAIIGAVPGVPVGTIFGNRIHLRFAGVHRPPMAGKSHLDRPRLHVLINFRNLWKSCTRSRINCA